MAVVAQFVSFHQRDISFIPWVNALTPCRSPPGLAKNTGLFKVSRQNKNKQSKMSPGPGRIFLSCDEGVPEQHGTRCFVKSWWCLSRTGALNRALLPNPCSLLCFKCHVQKVETPPIMLIIYATDLLFSFIKGDVHTLVSSNARAYCSIQVFC